MIGRIISNAHPLSKRLHNFFCFIVYKCDKATDKIITFCLQKSRKDGIKPYKTFGKVRAYKKLVRLYINESVKIYYEFLYF